MSVSVLFDVNAADRCWWLQTLFFPIDFRPKANFQCSFLETYSGMASLPPDDDGLDLGDDFALPPPALPAPKGKAKAKPKTKATGKTRAKKGEKKMKAVEATMPDGEESGDAPAGPSKKPKTEAGQDFLHHATTIAGQCPGSR